MTRMVLALMMGAMALMVPEARVAADVLLIEEVRQADRMALPANGMSKEDVRAKFGDPPITRWDYQGWSVYYEYDLVLFTVLQKGQVIDKT